MLFNNYSELLSYHIQQVYKDPPPEAFKDLMMYLANEASENYQELVKMENKCRKIHGIDIMADFTKEELLNLDKFKLATHEIIPEEIDKPGEMLKTDGYRVRFERVENTVFGPLMVRNDEVTNVHETEALSKEDVEESFAGKDDIESIKDEVKPLEEPKKVTVPMYDEETKEWNNVEVQLERNKPLDVEECFTPVAEEPSVEEKEDIKTVAQEKIDNLKEKAEEKIENSEAKDFVNDLDTKIDEIEKTFEGKKEDLKEDVEEIKEKVEEKVEEIKPIFDTKEAVASDEKKLVVENLLEKFKIDSSTFKEEVKPIIEPKEVKQEETKEAETVQAEDSTPEKQEEYEFINSDISPLGINHQGSMKMSGGHDLSLDDLLK